MTLKQLEILVAVANHGSISAAANFLNTSQSSLTTQIHLLEKDLGGSLLFRSQRGSWLTPAGERVVERARTILHEVALISEDVSRDGNLAGTVTIGMSPLSRVAVQHFPPVYRKFHQQFPNIQINVLEIGALPLTEGITKGEVDLAVMPLPIFSTHVRYERLWSEELVVVAPREMAELTNPIVLDTIKDYPFIFMKPGYGLNYSLLHLAQNAGFIPRVVEEASSISSLLGFVASGAGLAIVPRDSVSTELGSDLIQVFFMSPAAHRNFALAYRCLEDLTPAAQVVATAFRNYARKLHKFSPEPQHTRTINPSSREFL